MVKLTELGKREVEKYLREAEAKRKEIIDARKDTADETLLPTEDDILMDIEVSEEDGEYFNGWGVTDNYNTDYPLRLECGVHYKREESEMKTTFKHPETCYVFIPTDKSVGIVKWGERGYYKTNYPHDFTWETVAEINDRSGYTRTEIRAMQICSMVDSLPETNEAWEKHFNMVCGTFDRHGEEKIYV